MIDEKAVQRILRQLEREIRKEDGYFILNFGHKRKFPQTLLELNPTNYVLLKEVYSRTYEKSLNEYIKRHFKGLDRSVTQLVRYYETVLELMFGNEDHKGVYPMALRDYAERYGSTVDLAELLPSVESLFVQGYRVKEIDGKHFLVNPTLKAEIELESTGAEAKIRHYDYIKSLTELLKVSENSTLTTDEKIAVLSFELPSEAEKKTFNVPYDYKNALIRLNELTNLDEFSIAKTKLLPGHATALLAGEMFYGLNVSFIGQETRNYFWLLTDYAEHRIVSDLQEKYGFTFLQNLPTRYVIDHDGYLVSKVVMLPKGLARDSVNYYPTGMTQAYAWLGTLSEESGKALVGELATFCLLQIALGNNETDASTFQVEIDSRRLTNYHHSGASYLTQFAYKSVPNPLVQLKLNLDMNMMLEHRELVKAVSKVGRDGELPEETGKYFGFKTFKVLPDENIIMESDKVLASELPGNLLRDEAGVMAEVGKHIYNKEVGLYDNWFADHLKTSGVPEYSEPFLVLSNRFALLAVLAAVSKGMI